MESDEKKKSQPRLIEARSEIYKAYSNMLKEVPKINLLFIGKDPYPQNPIEIPFCKETFKELENGTCSGRYLLNGLGVDLADFKKYTEPYALFFNLLMDKRIALINASYDKLNKTKLTEVQKRIFREKNSPIIEKADFVIASFGAKKVLKQYLNEYLLKKINEVCHPDIRNKSKKHKELYETIWTTKSGLLKYFNLDI